MYVISVKAIDEMSVVEIGDDSLHKLQKMVGGFIEIVRPRYLREPYVMIVNEEGLLQGLPVNNTGSLLYGAIANYPEKPHKVPIVGDIVIMKEGFDDEGEPDILGMEEWEAKSLSDEFLRRFAYLELVR